MTNDINDLSSVLYNGKMYVTIFKGGEEIDLYFNLGNDKIKGTHMFQIEKTNTIYKAYINNIVFMFNYFFNKIKVILYFIIKYKNIKVKFYL
jgi:hypothetical protein